MTARRARATGTIVAGLALLALVAWQSGAKAVHYASDPSHEPCPALAPGDHTLTIDTPEGMRQVFLHAPRADARNVQARLRTKPLTAPTPQPTAPARATGAPTSATSAL